MPLAEGLFDLELFKTSPPVVFPNDIEIEEELGFDSHGNGEVQSNLLEITPPFRKSKSSESVLFLRLRVGRG